MRAACLIHVSTGQGDTGCHQHRAADFGSNPGAHPPEHLLELLQRHREKDHAKGNQKHANGQHYLFIPSPPFLSNLSLSYQLPPHFARRRRLSLAFIRFFCYHKANGLLLQQKGGRMEAYLGALRRVALFHGMEDRELLSMLDCLGGAAGFL